LFVDDVLLVFHQKTDPLKPTFESAKTNSNNYFLLYSNSGKMFLEFYFAFSCLDATVIEREQ
jgi:hypothetical protein